MKNIPHSAQHVIYDHSKESIDSLVHIRLKLKQLLKDCAEDPEVLGIINSDIQSCQKIAEGILQLKCMEDFYLNHDFKPPVSFELFNERRLGNDQA